MSQKDKFLAFVKKHHPLQYHGIKELPMRDDGDILFIEARTALPSTPLRSKLYNPDYRNKVANMAVEAGITLLFED